MYMELLKWYNSITQSILPGFCFLCFLLCVSKIGKFLSHVNMQFFSQIKRNTLLMWFRKVSFPGCFRVGGIHSEGQRSHDTLWVSSSLHIEFRREWCRQQSKPWSWYSVAEHLGFPTGGISMKCVISHHIFWKTQKRKSLEWNWIQTYNSLLSFTREDDVLH